MYRIVSLAILIGLVGFETARGDDWPQWMGPQRDNIWREKGIMKKFPAGGPKVVWRAPVAGGYAGPAVAGGKVFIADLVTADNVKVDNFRRGEFSGKERVICLDESTGEQLWSYEYPVKYDISYPAGPRCTPVVEGDRVYTLGAVGDLICFNVKDGAVVWYKDLKKEYGAKPALWGYAAHPLIDGDKIITLAGGEGAHVVALNKKTGAEIWRAQSAPETGYSPPTIIEAGGKRQLILLKPNAVASVDPETGKQYWSEPYEASNGSIIMSPFVSGNHMFVGGYSNKAMMLELASDKPFASVVWADENRKGVSPVNVQPFGDGDMIYAINQNGEMYGISVPSGERVWTSVAYLTGGRRRDTGTAFFTRNEDRFFLFTEDGELVIATIDKAGYKGIDRTKVITATNNAFGRDVVWCAPAYANKRMYVRNDEECICVDLAE